MPNYDSDSITVLEGLAPVRKRPGMYIGDTTNGAGLHHLLWELVSNVIDQHLIGNATELGVELSADGWITVRDDGGGIPIDDMPSRSEEPPISVLEAIFTRLHCGPTFDGHSPHVHLAPTMQGVGVAVVNALSEQLVVETAYRAILWTLTFERGERTSGLRRVGPATRDGTTVRFRADSTIFTSIDLDHEHVRTRLQELAWLNPHLRVYFQERRLVARRGIAGWARAIASARSDVLESYAFSQNIQDVRVDVGLAWNRDGETIVRSFVNMQPTSEGSHIDGLWLGLADYARAVKSPARRLPHVREAIGCGLVAVISVGMYAPQFGAPTRDQLVSPEAAAAVRKALRTVLAPDDWRTWRLRKFVDARLLCGERPPANG